MTRQPKCAASIVTKAGPSRPSHPPSITTGADTGAGAGAGAAALRCLRGLGGMVVVDRRQGGQALGRVVTVEHQSRTDLRHRSNHPVVLEVPQHNRCSRAGLPAMSQMRVYNTNVLDDMVESAADEKRKADASRSASQMSQGDPEQTMEEKTIMPSPTRSAVFAVFAPLFLGAMVSTRARCRGARAGGTVQCSEIKRLLGSLDKTLLPICPVRTWNWVVRCRYVYGIDTAALIFGHTLFFQGGIPRLDMTKSTS